MRSPTLVAVSLAVLVVPVSNSYAADEPSTCDGRPVTILVTEPQATVVGTEGPDVVVVTAGYVDVEALGGDDAICVEANVEVEVRAGAGDDVVLVPTYSYTRVELGPGEDRFAGGGGPDWVYAGDMDSDLERDAISTGGGKDYVKSGTPGHENGDVIHTGPMGDYVTTTTPSPTGLIDLGGGDNRLELVLTGQAPTSLDVHVAAAAVTVDGVSLQLQGAVRQWSLETSYPATLRFRGTDRGETLELSGPVLPRLLAETGGGPDTVQAYGALSHDSEVDLGSGDSDLLLVSRNVFRAPPLHQVNVDLVGHSLDFGSPGTVSLVRGVERLGLEATRVRVHGDDRDNVMTLASCDLEATGGEGVDKLAAYRLHGAGCRPAARLEGGPGPDRLFGSSGEDVLLGGLGRDVADGDRGIDTCRAEVTRHCEES